MGVTNHLVTGMILQVVQYYILLHVLPMTGPWDDCIFSYIDPINKKTHIYVGKYTIVPWIRPG